MLNPRAPADSLLILRFGETAAKILGNDPCGDAMPLDIPMPPALLRVGKPVQKNVLLSGVFQHIRGQANHREFLLIGQSLDRLTVFVLIADHG